MSKQQTRFGYLEPKVLDKNNNVVAEVAFFDSNGRAHTHNKWEICYILEGSGDIIIQYPESKLRHEVVAGNVLEIPPFCPHWMEVAHEHTMKILLVYTNKNYTTK